MKPKIVVLCFNYEPSQFPKDADSENRFFTYGFGGTFGRLFKKFIPGYDVEAWRVDGYCKEKYYEKDIDDIKYKVYRSLNINKLGYFSYRFLKDLKAKYKNENPIFFVVHTHNWQTYQIAWLLKGAKIITTHHGDWSPFFLTGYTSGLRKIKAMLGKAAEKMTFKNISYFLICDFNQVKYVQKAAPKMKYEIFTMGLDIHRFKFIPRADARTELGLEQDKKYILYVGKLYKYKQVDRLIEIWLDIKKDIPETELLIVGNETPDKWGEEYYDLAVNSGAKVIGRVLNTELYKYYCASDVYVLMALRDDYFGGTGIAPLESLSCNTPVVSTSMTNYLGDNISEIGEVPKNEKEYKDAIIKVLKNPEQYKNMRSSIDKFYSWESVSKRLDALFRKINENSI
jgi:glycosyltransferase involved in cell wall biosynthesis